MLVTNQPKNSATATSTGYCKDYANGKCNRSACKYSHYLPPHVFQRRKELLANQKKPEMKSSSSESELQRLRRENAELKQNEKIRHAVEQAKKEVKQELMKDVNELKKKVEKQEEVIGKQQVDIAVGKQAMTDAKSTKQRAIFAPSVCVSSYPRFRVYTCNKCSTTRYQGHSDCSCSHVYRRYQERWYEPATGSYYSSPSTFLGSYLAIEEE